MKSLNHQITGALFAAFILTTVTVTAPAQQPTPGRADTATTTTPSTATTPVSEAAPAPAATPADAAAPAPSSSVPTPAPEATPAPAAQPEPQAIVDAEQSEIAQPMPPPPRPKSITQVMQHMFNLVWNTGVTLGDSNDYAGKFSAFGFSFDYRYRVIPQLSVGALIGWNNFFDDVRDTATQGNLTVTGPQSRWMSMMPLCATVHAYLTNKSAVLPYLGLNLGGYFTSRIMDNGWWTDTLDGWHFGVSPEIGAYFPAGHVALLLNLKYNYLVKTDTLPSEMFFGINFGVAFAIINHTSHDRSGIE